MGMGLPGVVLPGLGIPGLGVPGLGVPGLGNASRIVVLKNAVDVEELRNPQDYTEIVQDMQVSRAAGFLERGCFASSEPLWSQRAR